MNCVLQQNQKGALQSAGPPPSSLSGKQEVGAAGPARGGPQARGHGLQGWPVTHGQSLAPAVPSLGTLDLSCPQLAEGSHRTRWLVTSRRGHCSPT